MSGIVEPPKVIVQTISINNYTYSLGIVVPHISAEYIINCFQDTILVKRFGGLLEGEQYKEWTTDDWLDRFIKQKVDELPDVEVIEPVPVKVIEPVPESAPEPTFTEPVV
jgi:hypothetical protein